MFKWIGLIAVVALSAVATTGVACEGHSEGKEPRVVTDASNNTTQKLSVGERFQVRLDSNASTGYEWSVKNQDTALVKLVGTPSFVAPENSAPGAGGAQLFNFETLAKGRTTLTLIYARPWEKAKQPAQTFSLTLDIE